MKILKFIGFWILVAGAYILTAIYTPDFIKNYITPTILIGIIVYLAQMHLTSKGSETSFRLEIKSLETKLSNMENRHSELEKKYTQLQEQERKRTHLDSLLEKYKFNENTGTRAESGKGTQYCNNCMLTKSLVSPLIDKNSYWHCDICGHNYDKKSYPPHREVTPPAEGFY